VDVYPTVAALAGLPPPPDLDGISLVPGVRETVVRNGRAKRPIILQWVLTETDDDLPRQARDKTHGTLGAKRDMRVCRAAFVNPEAPVGAKSYAFSEFPQVRIHLFRQYHF
jgi:hypothetical protein